MARLVAISDIDPTTQVELVADDVEGGYGGQCSRCPWTIAADYGCNPPLDDAANAAFIHVNTHDIDNGTEGSEID